MWSCCSRFASRIPNYSIRESGSLSRTLGVHLIRRAPTCSLFEGYTRLQPFAQESLKQLITPLVRSLGLKHPKILDIIERFPAGADDLILRVLDVLAEGARLPKNVIELIKSVAGRQALDPRFYVMIIADCDKVSTRRGSPCAPACTRAPQLTLARPQASIIKFLPRIVTLLNSTPEGKSMMRSIFLTVTAPPSQLVGANLPNRTKSDLITAVELMTLLHKSEKEQGLKCTIEGEFQVCGEGEREPPELTTLLLARKPLPSASPCPTPSAPRSWPPLCNSWSTSQSCPSSSCAPFVLARPHSRPARLRH